MTFDEMKIRWFPWSDDYDEDGNLKPEFSPPKGYVPAPDGIGYLHETELENDEPV